MTNQPLLHRPESMPELLTLLRTHGEDAKILAGGTAFTILFKGGLLRPDHVVSAMGVPGLSDVFVTPDRVEIGTLARLRDVERHPAVRRMHPVLAATLRLVANARVRNAATIGGNIAEADPTSDPPAVLAALDAVVHVASTEGRRELPFRDVVVDYFETALAADEMITHVVVPTLGRSWGGTYLKFLSRTAEDRTCLGVAAFVNVDAEGRCAALRLSVVGANPVPLRLPQVEEELVGMVLDEGTLRRLGQCYVEAADPVSDIRGSADYRRRVLGPLIVRAVQQAASRRNEAVLA